MKDQDVLQAQEAVKTAQEAVRVAKAQVDYQKAQLEKTVIRSPITGTVLQLAQQQGETLAAGLNAPTLIVVADLNRLQVDAYVDETDIGKVRLGQEADITVDAFPKAPSRAKSRKSRLVRPFKTALSRTMSRSPLRSLPRNPEIWQERQRHERRRRRQSWPWARRWQS